AGAGGDDGMGKAELADVLRRQAARWIDLDIGHALDLLQAMVADPPPFGEARQAGFTGDAPAPLLARLRQMHAIAALAQRPRPFEAGRPGADDEHGVVRPFAGDDLGMPALAPFLAHGGVLGAADRRDGVIAADADIAADAFADVLEPPLLDLLREKWIGDGGPR